ncbi:MAG: ATP-dependent 6-phosphofructokinase [Anaerolineales bacterium]|nr:ATP-dependent 6-phosphofructokinase [Anaerolineales bacterium]
MRKIGILTGGGDAPGLNAVIRAAVLTAQRQYGCEVVGIRSGFDGLLKPNGLVELSPAVVEDIHDKGGTILGAANRGNPFARMVMRDGEEVVEDASQEVVARIAELGLEALIVAGGDGTLAIARDLAQMGVRVVGVPKTIDNDVGGTEMTFGFDTALNIAVEAIDRLHTTAESHQRVMLLEVMGRDAGFIGLHAGLSAGADIILIPEIPFSYQLIADEIRSRLERGYPEGLVVVSEGARPLDGEQVFSRAADGLALPRLGGIAQQAAAWLEQECRVETRTTVLGHIQRGGTPTAFDRWLATRYGAAAVRLAASGSFGRMVSYQGGRITDVPLEEALAHPKRVDLQGDAVQTARDIGICLGD